MRKRELSSRVLKIWAWSCFAWDLVLMETGFFSKFIRVLVDVIFLIDQVLVIEHGVLV